MLILLPIWFYFLEFFINIIILFLAYWLFNKFLFWTKSRDCLILLTSSMNLCKACHYAVKNECMNELLGLNLQFLFFYTFPFIVQIKDPWCTLYNYWFSIDCSTQAFISSFVIDSSFQSSFNGFCISLFVFIILSWFILVMTADSSLVTTTRPLSLLGGSSVVLQSVPAAPTNLEAVITSTRFITLAWEPPSSTNGPITGYSIFYQQDGSER